MFLWFVFWSIFIRVDKVGFKMIDGKYWIVFLRFNGHGCVCRNKECIWVFLQMQHFCFLDLSKEQLCSIFVFRNVRFNNVVQINHDNVASRGAVGRTHIIVRLQTWNRRKDQGTENFGGFVYVLDGFPQRDFVLWVFMYPINISLFCDHLYFTATTPRATTHHPYHHGLSRLCMHSGYHAIVLCSIHWLSHQSYHAPPHSYIGLSHPP